MELLSYILGSVGILGTLLPFLRFNYWWIRIFDYLRAQVSVLLILSFAFFLFDRNLQSSASTFYLCLLLFCILYQGFTMLPYTPFYKKQVLKTKLIQSDSALSLLIMNVQMDNPCYQKCLEVIRKADPDLIIAVEPNAWWEKKLKPVEGRYPYTVKKPLENTYGMILFSKMEIIDSKISFLVEEDVPSIYAEIELRSGKKVQLYCLHPKPPVPPESFSSADMEAELLLIAKKVQGASQPVIVAGDLNDVAWSYTTRLFQKIGGLLDPRRGRGLFSTFHARHFILRWPLDYVFTSNHFKLNQIQRLDYVGSDHFPIYISFQYEPMAKFQQEKPVADEEDKEEAQEKIDDALYND